MRRPLPQPTLLDRAVAAISPAAGLRRMTARATLSAMGGGYNGARYDRRQTRNWRVSGGSADADIIGDLPALRERTRDAARNVPVAAGGLARNVTLTVGAGMAATPQVDRNLLRLDDATADAWEDRAKREFQLWAQSPNCDVTRTQDFAGLQDLCFRSMLESGDVLVVLRHRALPGWPYGLALQVYEGDQISNPGGLADGGRLESGNRCTGGVEQDGFGAPVAYHVQADHPGALAGRARREWVRIPAYDSRGSRQVLHLFERRRPGQTRGVPFLAPVIEQLKQLADYAEAELFAAVLSAMIAVIYKGSAEGMPNPDEANAETPAAASHELKFAAGQVLELDAESDVEVPSLGRPNANFDPFFTAVLRQIGAAIEIPFEVLIMHFTASYSASRAALEMTAQLIRRQRAWLVGALCTPVYDGLLAEAVASGRLEAPGFFMDPLLRKGWSGCDWIGQARISLDPLKENNADVVAEDRGWKTAAQNTAERGGDWEQKNRQRGREQRMRAEAGTMAPAVPAGPGAAPEPAPPPGSDLEDGRTGR